MKKYLTGLALGLLAIGLWNGFLLTSGAAMAQTSTIESATNGIADQQPDDELQTGASLAVDYKSPYSIQYTFSAHKRTGPDSVPPRGKSEEESYTPADRWYSKEIREKFGSWGPEPRHYSSPQADDDVANSLAWKRQRVLTVGESLIGMAYQHHHIPAWDPPADWPWKPVAWGKQSRGLDCSNFSSWLYNYGLGIKLLTNVHKQAETTQVMAADDMGVILLKTIPASSDYDALVKSLVAGDLLYIKNKKDEISHVIMWVGEYGRSPDGRPLVLDSTGSGHKDSNGNDIPVGVHLRPFTPDSWYFKSFSHAHRIIQ